MKAYVINLEGAPERLAHMRQTLGGISVAFERFDALDIAASVAHPEYASIPPMRMRQWIPGEIACLLSHYEVWRLVAEGEEPLAAVFEDDLIVDPRLKTVFDSSSHIPADADIIKLETGAKEQVALSRPATRTPGGPAYHRLRSLHYGSGAYAISRRAARHLVDSIAGFDLPVDDLLFTPNHPVRKHMRVYQAVPGLAIQNVNLPPHERVSCLGDGMAGVRAVEDARIRKKVFSFKGTVEYRLARPMREVYFSWFSPRAIVPFGLKDGKV